MKHLLIALLTFVSFSAFAGNGSGTMGIVLEQAQHLDLDTTPVIRFERVVNGKEIELSQLMGVDGNELILRNLLVKPGDLSPIWKEALKQSYKSKGWQLIDESEQVDTTALDQD